MHYSLVNSATVHFLVRKSGNLGCPRQESELQTPAPGCGKGSGPGLTPEVLECRRGDIQQLRWHRAKAWPSADPWEGSGRLVSLQSPEREQGLRFSPAAGAAPAFSPFQPQLRACQAHTAHPSSRDFQGRAHHCPRLSRGN